MFFPVSARVSRKGIGESKVKHNWWQAVKTLVLKVKHHYPFSRSLSEAGEASNRITE
jgi:hypothetical protein